MKNQHVLLYKNCILFIKRRKLNRNATYLDPGTGTEAVTDFKFYNLLCSYDAQKPHPYSCETSRRDRSDCCLRPGRKVEWL